MQAGFAHFAAKAFLKVKEIHIVAVCDVSETASKELSLQLNAATYTDYETFLKDEKINIVYIATPPFLHYSQSKKALLAGKHVLCEKPAALHVSEAEELHQ